ncbi:Putative flippase GtrA (transmembrane translocase of bactoprenol-linked glucose) [Lachnospiraceae bacterium XPB1003]|nr:Putative flippase GtrA (transmembrane translocase of bactoprenol-linked glucose) [Lachnospiraceae bacterium XPB1003]
MKKLFAQIVKFGLVGVICFIIDFGLYNGLNLIGVNYLISGAVGFIVSVVVNYILSFKFVFERKEDLDRRAEFIIFVVLSAIGLGVNELFIWLSVDVVYEGSELLQGLMGENLAKAVGKIFATGVVMVYNFVTRKMFLEKKTDNKADKKADKKENEEQ